MTISINLSEEQLAQLRVQEHAPKRGVRIDGPADGAALFKRLGKLKREHFVIATLDAAHQVIDQHTVSVGTLTASLVHPREVFIPAIRDRAQAIIVAHNHPSGSLTPSTADIDVTERLREAGRLIGIEVLDHFIITDGDWAEV